MDTKSYRLLIVALVVLAVWQGSRVYRWIEHGHAENVRSWHFTSKVIKAEATSAVLEYYNSGSGSVRLYRCTFSTEMAAALQKDQRIDVPLNDASKCREITP